MNQGEFARNPDLRKLGWDLCEKLAVTSPAPDPAVRTLPPRHSAQLLFISLIELWPFSRVMLTYLSPSVLLSLVRLHLPTLSTEPETEVLRTPCQAKCTWGSVAFSSIPVPGATLPAPILRPEFLAGYGGYSPRGSPVEGRC